MSEPVLDVLDTSESVEPHALPLCEGYNPVSKREETMEVLVRYHTPSEVSAAAKQWTVRRPGQGGRMEDTTDWNKYNVLAPDFYVAGFRNVTVAALRSLLLLGNDPPTDAEGHVTVDHAALARLLWVKVPFVKFSLPILNLSTDMLALIEQEKKLNSTVSGV